MCPKPCSQPKLVKCSRINCSIVIAVAGAPPWMSVLTWMTALFGIILFKNPQFLKTSVQKIRSDDMSTPSHLTALSLRGAARRGGRGRRPEAFFFFSVPATAAAGGKGCAVPRKTFLIDHSSQMDWSTRRLIDQLLRMIGCIELLHNSVPSVSPRRGRISLWESVLLLFYQPLSQDLCHLTVFSDRQNYILF